jgi:FAD/FMN-containing dehydrogenase
MIQFTEETPGYDDERIGYQLHEPHRPALVVAATSADDIRAAMGLGVPVAVQATGHGLRRPLDGGVLISTRRLTGVRVDPGTRTAWVEAGATWQHVIDAAAPHGLAPLSGSAPGVGAVSYTLGGGVGLLARRYGFAADHVRRLDLVTVDGRTHRVTADSEPDLFWALRGGGGGLGVVTGMEIDLMPVTHLYGGGLYFDVAQVPDVLHAWWRWTAGVPEDMTSAVAVLPFPDVPAVPEPVRGRHVAQVQIACTDPALVEPLRALGPVLDTVRELPYTESGAVFDEPAEPHAYRSANLLLSTMDSDALATLPALAGPAAPVLCVVGLRHLGGALARPPAVPNAVGHRDAGYLLSVLSPVPPGEADLVRTTHRDVLAPWKTHAVGRSLNASFGPLSEAEVADAFGPADHARLTALKGLHDPDGRLR